MRVAVYGVGYVGLVSAVCLAKLGHDILCVDVDPLKINKLSQGFSPIYEPGLSDLLAEQLKKGRLSFKCNPEDLQAQIHIIAVGTPSLEDGSADLSQIKAVTESIVKSKNEPALIVIKSTVPIGTADLIKTFIQDLCHKLEIPNNYKLATNPEFLREGSALHDFLKAERIIVGADDDSVELLRALYQPLIDAGIAFVPMSLRTAELTKYASNAMLACKISFINNLSQLAEEASADIDDLRLGMGLDSRIGTAFFNPGIGYGGSCFPKDLRALIQVANQFSVSADLFKAIESINETQKSWLFKQLSKHFASLKNLKIGLWGLAFKPGTDDLREAPSLVALKQILAAGASIVAFDPVAAEASKKLFRDEPITWCKSSEEVLNHNVDALLIATEWDEFRNFPLDLLSQKLKTAPLIDGRNCFRPEAVKSAKLACYYSIGRKMIANSHS